MTEIHVVTIPDTVSRAEVASTVDVMGVCKHVGDEVELITKAGKELKKREITLVDQSAHEVKRSTRSSPGRNR